MLVEFICAREGCGKTGLRRSYKATLSKKLGYSMYCSTECGHLNKRPNLWAEFYGELVRPRELSRKYGISKYAIVHRVRRGWKDGDLIKPINPRADRFRSKKPLIEAPPAKRMEESNFELPKGAF